MTETQEELIGVSRPMFDALVEYLMSRPFKEVSALINQLQQDSQIIKVAPETDTQQSEVIFDSPDNLGQSYE